MQPAGVEVDYSKMHGQSVVKYHISLLFGSSVFPCLPSTMSHRLSCGIYWPRAQEAPLYTK